MCVNNHALERDFAMSISGANLPIATRVSSASWSFGSDNSRLNCLACCVKIK